MKRVVSVSLGTSRRDGRSEVQLLGERILLERRGTDGDVARAEALIRELDGTVDAIGLGGVDIFLRVGEDCYPIADGVRLRDAARLTPVVDGQGLKDTLERRVVADLARAGRLVASTRVLMVSALDRFGMAQALVEIGCPIVFGDVIFTTGMDYPISGLEELRRLASRVLPQLARLPHGMLYPTGPRQDEQPDTRFARYFEAADLVAGDIHFIMRYLCAGARGLMVLTNSTTESDRESLARRGVRTLLTTTPVFQGRSYGTNLVEAMLVACLGPAASPDQYIELLDRAGLRPGSFELEVGQ